MALDAAEITRAHNFAATQNVCMAAFLGTEVAGEAMQKRLCVQRPSNYALISPVKHRTEKVALQERLG